MSVLSASARCLQECECMSHKQYSLSQLILTKKVICLLLLMNYTLLNGELSVTGHWSYISDKNKYVHKNKKSVRLMRLL